MGRLSMDLRRNNAPNHSQKLRTQIQHQQFLSSTTTGFQDLGDVPLLRRPSNVAVELE
jgi:hypothetical protein